MGGQRRGPGPTRGPLGAASRVDPVAVRRAAGRGRRRHRPGRALAGRGLRAVEPRPAPGPAGPPVLPGVVAIVHVGTHARMQRRGRADVARRERFFRRLRADGGSVARRDAGMDGVLVRAVGIRRDGGAGDMLRPVPGPPRPEDAVGGWGLQDVRRATRGARAALRPGGARHGGRPVRRGRRRPTLDPWVGLLRPTGTGVRSVVRTKRRVRWKNCCSFRHGC